MAEENIEERAKQLGWVDQENYDGRGEFVDAETFIARTEEEVPLLKKRLRRQDEMMETQLRELSELKQTVQDFSGFQKRAEENAYKRAVRDLQEKQRAAVEEGDTAAFDAAQREMESLEAPRAPEPSTPPPAPEFLSWKQANDWYGVDVDKTIYADQAANILARQGLKGQAFFDAVDEAVGKKYATQRPAQAVEGGGLKPRRISNGKGYDDLPSDAKATCDRFIKQIPGFTKEQYLADYDWTEDA